jgi:hypothetical protein
MKIYELSILPSQADHRARSRCFGKHSYSAARPYHVAVPHATVSVRSTQATFVKGPVYSLERSRSKQRDNIEKSHTLIWYPFHLRKRGTAASPPPFPSSSLSFYLSFTIDTTCNPGLLTIGGIVVLFYIDLEYSNTMFIIVDLMMCE